ncbi:MAG TPA: adenylate/guanylate cyclase domain-containing protein [Acidimicrobiales bacterium]|nr:adenylate/guanylate cyclase domain-containing protein [Acidimicrobiales bacterium]
MRVRRTFAFLDLSGFTALTESEGDERAVAVLAVFRAALRDICSRRGVRIAKWLGDGAMLVSVETMPLVAAALETKSSIDAAPEPITLRCGVTTGAVILLEGDDYVGHAVNVAARLCDLAVGHEVLAVPSVVPEIPPWATVEAADEIAVRGLEQPIDVVRLGLPVAGPTPTPTRCAGSRSPTPRPWPAGTTGTAGSCCSAPRAVPRCGNNAGGCPRRRRAASARRGCAEAPGGQPARATGWCRGGA